MQFESNKILNFTRNYIIFVDFIKLIKFNSNFLIFKSLNVKKF